MDWFYKSLFAKDMKKQYVYIIIGAALAFIFFYSLSDQSGEATTEETYAENIEKVRREKDNFFRQSEKSPIPDTVDFKGLAYYPPNPNYQVKAELEMIPGQEILPIPMSQGQEQEYIKYAWARFKLDGQKHRLLLLRKEAQEPNLFLAFTDATTKKETYGGGRYIDIPYNEESRQVTIDFNLAYHPYCVYNYNYACPLPPEENRLSISIKAGEKLEK